MKAPSEPRFATKKCRLTCGHLDQASLQFGERDFEPTSEIREAGSDPFEPPRGGPLPHRLGELAPVARRLAAAGSSNGRAACASCRWCDGFACAVNDLATVLLTPAVRRGLRRHYVATHG